MTAIIDADSMVYIVAYHHRDTMNIDAKVTVENACDSLLQVILKQVKAEKYIGSFSRDNTFRDTRYRYAPYKGNRPEKPDFVKYWEETIKEHYVKKWGFIIPVLSVEADDIVCALSHKLSLTQDTIICSPDKDMKQVPGYHFDYRVASREIVHVTKFNAYVNYWSQVVMGDTTDNIAGVPGIGKVGAAKLFKGMSDDFELYQCAMTQYMNYFGNFYGPMIFEETRDTIGLLEPSHRFYNDEFRDYIDSLIETNVKTVPTEESILENTFLAELGWS